MLLLECAKTQENKKMEREETDEEKRERLDRDSLSERYKDRKATEYFIAVRPDRISREKEEALEYYAIDCLGRCSPRLCSREFESFVCKFQKHIGDIPEPVRVFLNLHAGYNQRVYGWNTHPITDHTENQEKVIESVVQQHNRVVSLTEKVEELRKELGWSRNEEDY